MLSSTYAQVQASMRCLTRRSLHHVRGSAGVAQPNGAHVHNGTPVGAGAALEKEEITVHFVDPNCFGPPKRFSVRAPVGSTIVDIAKPLGVDIHAACGQKLQCATCHVILQKAFYDKLPPKGVREDDLLDSTFTLTPSSRLGCQVRLTPELDGIECTLPDNNFKGSVRMSMDMPRPKVETQWTAVPAVPQLPSRATNAIRQELDDQKNLTARLESELRQLRSKYGEDSKFMKRVQDASKKAHAEKEGEGNDDKDDLSKLKEELERCRVDLSKKNRRIKFDDVIGLEKAKRALREAVIWPAVADASLFSGIRGSSRGLLLYGPPGCGKTMIARAAASELTDRATFFHVRPADVMSKFYGDSQKRIMALEELVSESAPAVVFFDEVDSLLGGRDGSNVAEHHRATTNALLAWMDGFDQSSEQVFFLGATNRAEAIDEAALRRFGEAAEVEAPNTEARLALLTHLCGEKASADGHLADVSKEDLQTVAERTEGYSLADMDLLTRRAFIQVIRELADGISPGLKPSDVPPVKLGHFEAVLSESTGTSALREMLRKRGKTRAQL